MFSPSQNLLSMTEISCRLANFYYENSLFEIYIIGRFFEILWLKMLLLSYNTIEIKNPYTLKSFSTIWSQLLNDLIAIQKKCKLRAKKINSL